ncbi:MAG: glycosyltransferase family 2 protein [Candidatus Entotheonellia bacterium]
MTLPLVSCILATRNRRLFLQQAMKYFLRQTYANKELIIVDDSQASAAALVPDDAAITYIKLDAHMTLGSKLNLGIGESYGQIVQKLDDDDYYHPDFLRTTVTALLGRDPARVIVGLDCFLVLIAATGELKWSGHGWCAGGTLCFFRGFWEQSPFRDVPRAVDWWFLHDHPSVHVNICNPELYILVRHRAGHLWTMLKGLDVTDYFARRPAYRKTLVDCLSIEDQEFYRRLKRIAPGIVAEEASL